MEAALGAEVWPEPMSVAAHQEKLLEKLNLDGLRNCSPRNAAVTRELVLTYHDIFGLDSNKLGCTSAIKYEIHIDDSEPFKEWFQCIPPLLLEGVCATLRDMLEAGAIHPKAITLVQHSGSSEKERWDIVFLCQLPSPKYMDKERLYPLPKIQEALESMARAAHFSSMDFKSRFWQVRMVPESQKYTMFTIGNLGFYKFIHIYFGLCNVPATFQCLTQNTLGELNLTYCIIYLDDVIVFGHMEEHLECLHIIFERFCEFNLKLKPSKCSFFQSEIVYLAKP